MAHLAADDWDAIKCFIGERASILDCKGPAGHTGPDGSRWYSLDGVWEIRGFVMCEACYSDLITWNHLKRYFTTGPTIKSDEGMWTCDAAVPVVKEGLRRAIASPDHWEDLHILFKRRMEYPGCVEMRNLQAGSTHWYGSKAVPGLIVCTACYLDYFVLDHARSWDLLSLCPDQERRVRQCAMDTWHMKVAWTVCTRIGSDNHTDEYDGFEAVARAILGSPPCSTEDMRDAIWYAPRDYHGDAFAICHGCVVASMVAPGFFQEFKQVHYPRNKDWVCDFNPAAPRSSKYTSLYDAAVTVGNFSIFSDYVSAYAALAECPRNEPFKNRRWYGKNAFDNTFTICELCYKDAVEGTRLANRLDSDVVPDEARCQMYSPRMRDLWRRACQTNDLDSFLVLAKERMHTYLFMQMEKQRVEFGQLMRMQQRQTLMLASTINQGTEGFASVATSNGGPMFGNRTIGFNWHSAAGAQAHQQFQQALGINVVQTGDSTELMSLMQRWAELE
ncbi:uncharacterized protein CDV56_100184 [Aspergillus thermomutatus]|uniref:Integral membrane protein n=1 Tax=Aspergillus thermomutatus TaxID=41047 RepID=A0A397GKN6_ASPTH|nr:uncharacterized protein CDV56_100184 [Aspergillus thermomutatus]RHZ49633.1 hypothetical protein CDV56_100184 [Aspergillus thermomutatus]